MISPLAFDYDREIRERMLGLEVQMARSHVVSEARQMLRHWSAVFPITLITNYLKQRGNAELIALHAIEEQVAGGGPRVGNTTVLVPVYDEPIENLKRLIDSLVSYEGELILLFNSGQDSPTNQRYADTVSLKQINEYATSICGPLKLLTVDVIGTLKCPSVGTARDLLFQAEAYRSINSHIGASHLSELPGRKLLITDADCAIPEGFMKWFDGIFDHPTAIVALVPKIKYLSETNPATSEGIDCKDHLKLVMVGEFYRNVIAAAIGGSADRETREWIGMGIGTTLQAAMLSGGMPQGWKRKEDHFFGAMLETLARYTGGSIYRAVAGDPYIESFVRGSSRTDAGLGVKGGHGNSGLATLCDLAILHSATRIAQTAGSLTPAEKHKILTLPTTDLLKDLLGLNWMVAGLSSEQTFSKIFESIESQKNLAVLGRPKILSHAGTP